MTADRGWWRRLSAKNRSPWADGELAGWINARRQDRIGPVLGPEPPPDLVPAHAEWSLTDRQNDPALTHGWLFPHADGVPRVVDARPHH